MGEQEIGLDPHGHQKGMAGPIGYVPVEDIKAHLQRLVDAGGQLQQDPTGTRSACRLNILTV